MNPPEVSVVVPTFNAGPRFEELMDRLSAQEGDFEREILVVDSGSTDGTVELARRHGAAVHGIDPAEFNHGATRNLGISLSRGKFVALVVQDALPLDGRWLAAMVEDLERDERVAGVYGRQISHPGCGALTRVVVDNRPTASPERREQFVPEGEEYAGLAPQARWRLASFDNVSSCLRRSVWEEFPFERTGFGEDLRWGKRVVEAGHKLVYEPRSTVLHSHERGALYELRRHYVNQLVLLDLFGLKPVPNPGYLLLSIPRSFLYLCRLLLRDEKTLGGLLRLTPQAAVYSVAAQTGAYLGGNSRRLAELSPRYSARLHRFLSKSI